MMRDAWIDRYGPLVAEQIDPECRYSLVEIGGLELAYASYEGYVRALRDAWHAGHVPESRGSVAGSRLLETVPNLVAIDAKWGRVQAPDSSRPS